MASTQTASSRVQQLARRRGRARRLRKLTLAGALLLAAAAAIVLSQTLGQRSELSLNSPAALPLDI
jgi:hypothetical protein